MKGKKTDPDFVAKFIQNAVRDGLETPEQFVAYAKQFLEACDKAILEAEVAKKMRPKYLDVIAAFEKPTKDKTEDAKLLSFFKIEDAVTSKRLCDMVKSKPFIPESQSLDTNARYALKQLLEAKVLTRQGKEINKGERFDEYMKFVLRED